MLSKRLLCGTFPIFSTVFSMFSFCHFLSHWLKMFIHNPNQFFFIVFICLFFLNILLIKQLLSSNYHTRSIFDNRKKMIGKAIKKIKNKKINHKKEKVPCLFLLPSFNSFNYIPNHLPK